MRDRKHDARVAALWILHGGACVKLLRAHGRPSDAENFAAALDAVAEIVAGQVGRETLNAAMDWASNQIWGSPETISITAPDRKYLH